MAGQYRVNYPVTNPGTQEQEWYTLREGIETPFFLSHWFPTNPAGELIQPKAAVVFVHGFADYCQRYDGVFQGFAERGYQVSGFDQFGFGSTWYESPERATTHGWTTWAEQMADMAAMVKLTRARLDKKWGKDAVPMYMLGHSMGGGLVAGFFTRDPSMPPGDDVKQMLSGAMMSAPWLDIHYPVPRSIAVPVLRTLLNIFPRLSLPLGPLSNDLSRDAELCEANRRDPLSSTYVHLRCLLGPLGGGLKVVQEEYKRWPEHLPLLICHGTGDRVTQCEKSARLYHNLKALNRSVRFVSFEGFYHEGFFEPGEDKLKFARAFWVLRRHKTQYPLVVMVTEGVNEATRCILTQMGCVVRDVAAWGIEADEDAMAQARFVNVWTKLRAMELYEYDRVVLVDVDMLVVQNMDELMDLSLGPYAVGASFACTCNPNRIATYPATWVPENCGFALRPHPPAPTHLTRETHHRLNSGLVVLDPDRKRTAQLHAYAESVPERVRRYSFPDQDLLADAFHGAFLPLPWYYNALKTLRRCHPDLWDDGEVRNIHFILEHLHDMWWDAYNALASQPEQIGLSHDEWSHYVAVHTT
ncbi:acylglycerol lipase [Malassezia equina]|uniref:Acylglycerol lipase n=1 Tax=Malassezia equina TaxID=1381935 RepID=A0AAF0IZZ4_9BASI|nr:acylglycerol lipase [Malassezia equina]